MLVQANNSNQFDAVIGDLLHKQDVYLNFGRVDSLVVQRFLTNKAQADWLKDNLPQFVPPNNPSGDPPSDHTVATIFEVKYNDPSFRVLYVRWLRAQYV